MGKAIGVMLLSAAMPLAAVAIGVGVAMVLTSREAWPHEAVSVAGQPLGWSYPWQCCSGIDCQQVPETAISEPSARQHGYTIKATGEFIAEGDKRLKDSPDGLWHWCAHQAGIDAGKTICLFRPRRGF